MAAFFTAGRPAHQAPATACIAAMRPLPPQLRCDAGDLRALWHARLANHRIRNHMMSNERMPRAARTADGCAPGDKALAP